MCEILFRGKRIDNGEWVYGFYWRDLWSDGKPAHIINAEDYLVDPSTVCQYTGLTDKNDVKIFEGDIVKFRHGGEFDRKGIYYRNYAVEFVNTYVTYGLRLRNKSINFPFKQATASVHDAIVVGNVFDNPELLKEDSYE